MNEKVFFERILPLIGVIIALFSLYWTHVAANKQR